MAGTVAAAVATYGDSQQRIVEVHRIFPALREALWTHMFREEHGLYSSIVYLDENHIELSCPSGLVTRAIRAIRRDHRYFRSVFRRIAQLLDNYDIPVNSGQRYVNLVHGLRDLESSKLEHMKKEHLVYARALALERQIRRK
jgi:iron-sulfur cluster repair protein YtfE (RIC family)